MAPFDVNSLSGTLSYALIFIAIGISMGAVLELSGFGDTRKLVAQFYLTDMTVLKVMFTAIAVCAVLLFGASAFGLLDLGRVWVNPTYLWPGIVGGLIMGVGFVVGGFCPGTSVVSAATLKIDGMMFVGGALAGVYLFGETVGSFESFFLSSSYGRVLLPDWLGLPAGVVVLAVVIMALLAFWGAEVIEARMSGKAPVAAPGRPWRRIGAGALVGLAAIVMLKGQPTDEERWAKVPAAVHQMADERTVFVHPAEVVALRTDTSVQVQLLDLRDEHDFNLFHIGGSRRVAAATLEQPAELKALLEAPSSTVTLLVGNGEATAFAAWKALKGRGVPNLYVIEGGVRRWLELYPTPSCVAERLASAAPDDLGYRFAYATGQSLPSAWPELPTSQEFRFPCKSEAGPAASEVHGGHASHGFTWPTYAFTKHVKLQTRSAVKGGCG